jgi:two-component sensor histidine kinase
MNALALVQSIVRQARGATVETHSALIIGRVDALARAHRLMARAGWSGADLGELVAGEIADAGAGRVRADGAETHLSPRLVQPLALVLHELMLNATMHGALATPEGQVRIDWHANDNRLHLAWQEQGVTAIHPPAERGMGLSVLSGVVERQLAGRVTTAWDAPGFSANIELPVGSRGDTSA